MIAVHVYEGRPIDDNLKFIETIYKTPDDVKSADFDPDDTMVTIGPFNFITYSLETPLVDHTKHIATKWQQL